MVRITKPNLNFFLLLLLKYVFKKVLAFRFYITICVEHFCFYVGKNAKRKFHILISSKLSIYSSKTFTVV